MTAMEQDEAILADFRRWLAETFDEAQRASGNGPSGEAETIGLGDLVEAFTALRHELKLQTKSARTLQEQAAAASEAMQAALANLSRQTLSENPAMERTVRPLLETLADLDEALRRGARAVEAARQNVGETLAEQFEAVLDEEFDRLPAWRRWAARPWRDRAVAACRLQAGQARADSFDALAEGFALIQARLDRALREHDLQRIPCVGRQVDPNAMTVVAVVDDSAREPGEVIEEVRPGYRWKGAVIRYAEVAAVREPSSI
jgi:molecular chaperone GrpE